MGICFYDRTYNKCNNESTGFYLLPPHPKLENGYEDSYYEKTTRVANTSVSKYHHEHMPVSKPKELYGGNTIQDGVCNSH